MIDLRKSTILTKDSLSALSTDPRCKFGEQVTIEEGASIYLDPAATHLTIQDKCHISRGAHIEVNRGATVIIGRNVTVGRDSTIAAMCRVEIGDGVGIANSVSIRDHNHRTNSTEYIKSSEPTPWASGFEAAPIVVERMALLSDGVRVLPGVRIGQNSLVGAGVHVRRTIPPNCKAVGDSEKIRIIETFQGPLEPTEPYPLKFHFFGDSLIDRPAIVTANPHYDLPTIGSSVPVLRHETAGFYKLVLQRLQGAYPEQRFAFQKFAEGGSTIRDVQAQVSGAVAERGYWDVSFIGVGINDIWRKYQGRHSEAVGLEEFAERYSQTIEELKKKSRMVFCIGEPLVSVGENTENINRDLKRYNDFIKELSIKANINFVDLFEPFQRTSQLMQAYNPNESLWIDGVHLSDMGNLLAADIIFRFLEQERVLNKLFRLQSFERDEATKRYV